MTMPDPTDLGDSKYDVLALYHTADGMPVVIRRSIAITPMPWCVQRGTSAVFFCTYKETHRALLETRIQTCRIRRYFMKWEDTLFVSKTLAVGKRRYKKTDGTTITVTKDIRYTVKDGSSTIHMYDMDNVKHYCKHSGYRQIP